MPSSIKKIRRLGVGAEFVPSFDGNTSTVLVSDLPEGGTYDLPPLVADGDTLLLPHASSAGYVIGLKVTNPEVAKRLGRALLSLAGGSDDAGE